MSSQIVLAIMLWLVGLFILYLVITTAVKDGINKSVVGRYIDKKYGMDEENTPFLDKDLDNDK